MAIRPCASRSILIWAAGCAVASAIQAQAPRPEFLYKLADFSGELPYSDAAVRVDEARSEVLVGEGDAIRVYNHAGMQEYEFFLDSEIGVALDIAPMADGNLAVLSFRPAIPDRPGGTLVTLCDFRGKPLRTINVLGFPAGFEDFSPNHILVEKDGFLFVSRGQMQVIRTDSTGQVTRTWDLGRIAGDADPPEPGARPRGEADLGAFALDHRGRFLFTVPVRFRAFRLDPETGEAEVWGKGGSNPGRFGITSGIAGDPQGYIFVADRARSAVLVFDPNLHFVREFGNTRGGEGQLRRPGWIAYGNGRLYVTQMGKRGISVFSVEP